MTMDLIFWKMTIIAALVRDLFTVTQQHFDNADNITEKTLFDFLYMFLTSKVLLFLLLLGLCSLFLFCLFFFFFILFSFYFLSFFYFLSVSFFLFMGFTVVIFEFLCNTFRLSCIRLFQLYDTVFSFFSILSAVRFYSNRKMGDVGLKL